LPDDNLFVSPLPKIMEGNEAEDLTELEKLMSKQELYGIGPKRT